LGNHEFRLEFGTARLSAPRPVEADEECTSLLLPDLIGEGRCEAIAAEPQREATERGSDAC
jgi:hypothetical protein